MDFRLIVFYMTFPLFLMALFSKLIFSKVQKTIVIILLAIITLIIWIKMIPKLYVFYTPKDVQLKEQIIKQNSKINLEDLKGMNEEELKILLNKIKQKKAKNIL